MKKTLALLMALMLVISTLAMTAAAEEESTATDQISSATVRAGRGGKQQTQNGQMPQTPNQNNQVPGQNRQMPGRGGRQENRFGSQNTPDTNNRTGRLGKHIDLAQLVADGVITQEVSDAITNYLNEKAQQAQQPAAETAEGAENTESAEPPALPENVPDGQNTAEEELLKGLLDSGAITQEQYDQLLKKMTPPEPPVAGT